MEGRHKNFEDLIVYEVINRLKKCVKLYIFLGRPLMFLTLKPVLL
jgi:hypothetical protein